MSAILKGSCCCERFSFAIPTTSVRFGFASCHCTVCRRLHAAPFVLWSGMNASESKDFIVTVPEDGVGSFRSSDNCTRYFCNNCGSHVYIKYDDSGPERWAGEIHFPTSILDATSLPLLEKEMENKAKPRYLHVFASDRIPFLGDLKEWAAAPKYGGETGLEPIAESLDENDEK